jgi:hypothetical protein
MRAAGCTGGVHRSGRLGRTWTICPALWGWLRSSPRVITLQQPFIRRANSLRMDGSCRSRPAGSVRVVSVMPPSSGGPAEEVDRVVLERGIVVEGRGRRCGRPCPRTRGCHGLCISGTRDQLVQRHARARADRGGALIARWTTTRTRRRPTGWQHPPHHRLQQAPAGTAPPASSPPTAPGPSNARLNCGRAGTPSGPAAPRTRTRMVGGLDDGGGYTVAPFRAAAAKTQARIAWAWPSRKEAQGWRPRSQANRPGNAPRRPDPLTHWSIPITIPDTR